MKLIDTDILIDHFHGHRAALNYLAQQIAQGEMLAISVVTIAEFSGGMRSGEEPRTERLLALFTVLDADETVALQAGHYLRQFRQSHGIELGDALIAASAKQVDAEIVTRNRRHYPMSGISIVVPYERGRQ